MSLKQAFILGATTELGFHLAENLISQNYRLILSSMNSERLNERASLLKEKYPSVEIKTLRADLNNQDDVQSLMNQLESEWVNIDLCIFCMGLNEKSKEDILDFKRISEITNVNFLSPMQIVSSLLKACKNNPKRKSICYVSSVAAIRPINHFIYSSGKIASEYFLRGLKNQNEFQHINLHIFRLGRIRNNPQNLLERLTSRSPKEMADGILKKVNQKSGRFYIPKIWNFLQVGLVLIPDQFFSCLYRKIRGKHES